MPEMAIKTIKQKTKKRGFKSVSDYIKFLVKQDDETDRITKEELLEEPVVEKIRETSTRISGILSSFQSLTDTQRTIFKTLYLLQKEKAWAWVLLKDIANEIYPTKSYNAVRSTISDYLSILEEIGLVQRKRVSRQSMVSLTEVGKEFIKSAQEEIEFIKDPSKKPKALK